MTSEQLDIAQQIAIERLQKTLYIDITIPCDNFLITKPKISESEEKYSIDVLMTPVRHRHHQILQTEVTGRIRRSNRRTQGYEVS